MKKISIICFLVITSFATFSQKNVTQLKTKTDSLSYAIGVNIALNMKDQGITQINGEALNLAIQDVFANKELVFNQEKSMEYIMNCITEANAKKHEGNKKSGEDYLASNSKKPKVVTLPSGLQYKIIKQGNGAKPTINNSVTTHYKGWLIDGKVFDSSYDRNEPATFPVNGVIKGWTEALQLMQVGSIWEIYIPYKLAYGERGAGNDIPPYATLIFQIELLDIQQ